MDMDLAAGRDSPPSSIKSDSSEASVEIEVGEGEVPVRVRFSREGPHAVPIAPAELEENDDLNEDDVHFDVRTVSPRPPHPQEVDAPNISDDTISSTLRAVVNSPAGMRTLLDDLFGSYHPEALAAFARVLALREMETRMSRRFLDAFMSEITHRMLTAQTDTSNLNLLMRHMICMKLASAGTLIDYACALATRVTTRSDDLDEESAGLFTMILYMLSNVSMGNETVRMSVFVSNPLIGRLVNRLPRLYHARVDSLTRSTSRAATDVETAQIRQWHADVLPMPCDLHSLRHAAIHGQYEWI